MDVETIAASLEREGFVVTEWRDEPFTAYPEHSHARREVRVVIEGSLVIVVDGVEHALGPGDRIEIEIGETHSARVGAWGARYLSGH